MGTALPLNAYLLVTWWSIFYALQCVALRCPQFHFTIGIALTTGTLCSAYHMFPYKLLNLLPLSFCCIFRCNHNNCFSKRQGSLFACPKNDLFSEQGLVEYECWERIDVTEQMWNQQQLQGAFFILLNTSLLHCMQFLQHPLLQARHSTAYQQLLVGSSSGSRRKQPNVSLQLYTWLNFHRFFCIVKSNR